MSKRDLVLLFFLLAGIQLAFPQTTLPELAIHWQSPKDFPVFDQASYPDQDHSVPIYSTRLPAVGYKPEHQPVITLSQVRYEAVPEEEKKYYTGLDLTGHHIHAFVQTERKKAYVRLELNPVRRNPVSGQLERLLGFQPQISWQPTLIQDKQTLKATNFAAGSVLSQGKWYKIAITESGIYKITYDDLVNMGFENPASVRVFGNGGKQLPFDSSLGRMDDLVENPVYIYTGNDGSFDSGDYLLFYGKGIVHWQYDTDLELFVHRLHQFSDEAFYFLTDTEGSGRKISTQSEITESPDQETSTYDYYVHREKDSVNLIKSGRQWVWKHFNIETRYEFLLPLGSKVSGAPVKIYSSLLVRSTKTASNSGISVLVNNNPISTFSFAGVNTGNYEALYASGKKELNQVTVDGNEMLLTYQFVPSNPAAVGWIDFFDVNTRSQLSYDGSPLYFRDIQTVGEGHITRFNLSGTQPNLFLWDVSQPDEVTSLPLSGNGTSQSFIAKTDQLREFVLFDPSAEDIPKPTYEGERLGEVPNQNLHGMASPEMLIIVQPELRDQAEELAELHREHDGLSIEIVEPEAIYNEFSTGMLDPTAIRDFARMLYKKDTGTDTKLRYLLLFGDGTYDNKQLTSSDEFRNYLPTYQ